MITPQPSFFASNQTHLREIETRTEAVIVAPANASRRGGLIVNLSHHDFYVWFGTIPPVNPNDWLIIPSRANCDIPLFFVGDIHGLWLVNDTKTAKIYEFYGI